MTHCSVSLSTVRTVIVEFEECFYAGAFLIRSPPVEVYDVRTSGRRT
jgi:hypothetical protein